MTQHETAANAQPQPDRLDELRSMVDAYDELIVGLVAGRTALTLEIGREKRERGLLTFVPQRHGEVVGNYMATVPDGSPMLPGDAVALSEVVQQISRGAQERAREAGNAATAASRAELEGLAAQSAALLERTGGIARLSEDQ